MEKEFVLPTQNATVPASVTTATATATATSATVVGGSVKSTVSGKAPPPLSFVAGSIDWKRLLKSMYDSIILFNQSPPGWEEWWFEQHKITEHDANHPANSVVVVNEEAGGLSPTFAPSQHKTSDDSATTPPVDSKTEDKKRSIFDSLPTTISQEMDAAAGNANEDGDGNAAVDHKTVNTKKKKKQKIPVGPTAEQLKEWAFQLSQTRSIARFLMSQLKRINREQLSDYLTNYPLPK